MQDTSHYMVATRNRRVIRVLMEEEEEFIEIDSIQGLVQKRLNGKVKDSTEKHSEKKSKGVETAIVTMLEKLDNKLWLGFSYMEQLAAEEGLPKCITNGPTEDLVAMGYKQEEVEELEQAKVAFLRVPQKLYPSVRKDKVLGQHYNLT